MDQRISSANQRYLRSWDMKDLEDEREIAIQRRQAAQYRREREVQQVTEYSAEYW